MSGRREKVIRIQRLCFFFSFLFLSRRTINYKDNKKKLEKSLLLLFKEIIKNSRNTYRGEYFYKLRVWILKSRLTDEITKTNSNIMSNHYNSEWMFFRKKFDGSKNQINDSHRLQQVSHWKIEPATFPINMDRDRLW